MVKVYGDIMLDSWIIGKASRISPEAPVPVLKEIERKNIILPVVRCELKFIKPLVFGDYFSIKVFCSKKPTSTIEFNYEIFNENNELTTEGITTLAFLDSLTRKPLRCPKILNELF